MQPISFPVVSKAIDRFLKAAEALGHPVEVRRFPEGTKTAEDAARAIGCEVGQIVKSLVFMADDEPVLALTSGANRVDLQRLAELAGATSARRATLEEARAATGFAVGGTPPFSDEDRRVRTVVDETLLGFDQLWAAAGTPDAVFPIRPDELVRVTGGIVVDFAEKPPADQGPDPTTEPEGQTLETPQGAPQASEGEPYGSSSVFGAVLLTLVAPFISVIAALLLRGSQTDPARSRQLRTWAIGSAIYMVVGWVLAIFIFVSIFNSVTGTDTEGPCQGGPKLGAAGTPLGDGRYRFPCEFGGSTVVRLP